MTRMPVASMTSDRYFVKKLQIFSGMEKYLRRSLSCSDIERSVHRTVAPIDIPDRVKKCVMACLIVSLYTCHDVDHAVEKTMLCLHELGTIQEKPSHND